MKTIPLTEQQQARVASIAQKIAQLQKEPDAYREALVMVLSTVVEMAGADPSDTYSLSADGKTLVCNQ